MSPSYLMSFFCFGLSHRTANLSLLESVSFSPGDMGAFLASLRADENIREAFGLSTCNRTEFLIVADNSHDALTWLLRRLFEVKGVDLRGDGAGCTFFYAEEMAVRHIFRVACGVESLVIGENEILGQLRRAREAAADAGHIGESLDSLLLRAIDVGRRVRQNTGISRGNVSVSSVAATLAERRLEDLSGCSGVVLGAGETAEVAAYQLKERGLGRLTIVNRTDERAAQLATAVGAHVAGFGQLETLLSQADVVVCATGAPDYVVGVSMVKSARSHRGKNGLLFLDVSVPRNVDPAVGTIEGVDVYSLEDLTQLAEENRAAREAQVVEVEKIIETELDAYRVMRSSMDTSRLVSELYHRIERVRRDHLARHGHRLDGVDEERLDLFSSSLTRSLLHEFVENIRSLDLATREGRERFEIARELFNLGSEKSDAGNESS